METVKRNKCFGTIWNHSAGLHWASPCFDNKFQWLRKANVDLLRDSWGSFTPSVSDPSLLHLKAASTVAVAKGGTGGGDLPAPSSPSTCPFAMAKVSTMAPSSLQSIVENAEERQLSLTWRNSLFYSYCNDCMLDPDCGFCYRMNKSTVIDSSCVPVNKASTNEAAWGRYVTSHIP